MSTDRASIGCVAWKCCWDGRALVHCFALFPTSPMFTSGSLECTRNQEKTEGNKNTQQSLPCLCTLLNNPLHSRSPVWQLANLTLLYIHNFQVSCQGWKCIVDFVQGKSFSLLPFIRFVNYSTQVIVAV